MIQVANGIDLVEIKRFTTLAENIRSRFVKRVFTPAEVAESGENDAGLAGLFAAKEAAAKALGSGIGPISWQEIEVRKDPEGKPALVFTGKALELIRAQGWTSWAVSISHTSEYAAAVVTALLEVD